MKSSVFSFALLLVCAGLSPVLAQTDCMVQADIPQAECEALLDLYNDTNGPGWTTNTGWDQDNFPCSWHGVSCSGNQVNSLLLFVNNLTGTLPGTLGDLTALQTLNLSSNNLTGAIPTELGTISTMTSLNLSGNSLNGSIPSSLGSLSNIVGLFLHNNSLNGSIPTQLGNINPETLRLDGNDLNGSIPPELGNLNLTQVFRLDGNDLTGTVPYQLGNLAAITDIRLNGNMLQGTVPFVVAQVGAAAISACDFTGNVPGLCMPDTPDYQGLGDPICGLNLDQNCTPLPVELALFTALVDGQAVVLHWETLTESHNSGFEVEHKSVDAEPPLWETLDWVAGVGTSIEAQSYHFTTPELAPGLHRFRLKQIDLDGTFEYSKELEVKIEVPAAFVFSEAFPNPFGPKHGSSTTRFTLTVAHTQPVRVEVFDAAGRLIDTLHDGPMVAEHPVALRFDANGLPGGMYVIRAHGSGLSESRSVLFVK